MRIEYGKAGWPWPESHLVARVRSTRVSYRAMGDSFAAALRDARWVMALATEPSLTTVARDNRLDGDEVKVIRTTVVAGAIALALACAGPAGAASPYDFAVGGGYTSAG